MRIMEKISDSNIKRERIKWKYFFFNYVRKILLRDQKSILSKFKGLIDLIKNKYYISIIFL
jgi:hypothetical protein